MLCIRRKKGQQHLHILAMGFGDFSFLFSTPPIYSARSHSRRLNANGKNISFQENLGVNYLKHKIEFNVTL